MSIYTAYTAMGAVTGDGDTRHQGDLILVNPKPETKKPPFFKVVLLNDDFTPMEFVVQVLREVFHKMQEEAQNIMLEVRAGLPPSRFRPGSPRAAGPPLRAPRPPA